MKVGIPGEQWKTIQFDFEFTNDGRIEVSNFGRIRTFNKISDGNIIKGSLINGYKIIRLKLYKPRSEQNLHKLEYLKGQISKLASQLKLLKSSREDKDRIEETTKLLQSLKSNLSKAFKDDLKGRTLNYHSLFHRLVANYFLPKPTVEQTVVGHLDHDKLNNRVDNLRWMTLQKNAEHQRSSPLVIKAKLDRRSRGIKLTTTKVMLMKKLLNEGKPVKQLSKIFKVTETQILRIKRGENWADIEAAK